MPRQWTSAMSLDLVTKVTNLSWGGNRSLNHRKFVAFLVEVSAAYGDLQMHTEIWWMNCGKCLERFFALRTEIPVFLEEIIRCDAVAYWSKLRDTDFNHLNLQFQGRDQTVSDLYACMSAFKHKLALFKVGFSADHSNFSHFPANEEMCKDVP